MAKPKDPAEVVAGIKGSIEASSRKSRRVRFHNLRNSFGWHVWTAQRKELVEKLLADNGILPQPALSDAELDDWILLSMPVLPDNDGKDPDPRPSDEWFDHLVDVNLSSEREVELHFASPLFHQLDYEDVHEAAGFGFILHEGVSHKRVEADLVYFADGERSNDATPLVLLEAKSSDHKLEAAVEQARSYANALRPAYYVVTNGDRLMVWNYQGAIPDVKIMDFYRAQLSDNFDDLYRLLNRETVIEARIEKLKVISGLAAKSSAPGA